MPTAAQTVEYGEAATRILDAAERLVQERGFNGFSYADIAAELGVTKPSLHYHFAGKADLGLAVVERYRARFSAHLRRLAEAGDPAPATLLAYADLYSSVLDQGRLCLCGMLAAEFMTLPDPIRDAVLGFFAENQEWLTQVLKRGRAEGTLRFPGTPGVQAQLVLGALEGAMLVARAQSDPKRLRAMARSLVAGLSVPQD